MPVGGVYQAIGAATGAVQAGVVLPAPAAAVESGVDVTGGMAVGVVASWAWRPA